MNSDFGHYDFRQPHDDRFLRFSLKSTVQFVISEMNTIR